MIRINNQGSAASGGAPQEFAIAGDSPEAELPPYDDEAEDLPDVEADETEPAVAEGDGASKRPRVSIPCRAAVSPQPSIYTHKFKARGARVPYDPSG